MRGPKRRRAPSPLDRSSLNELALTYVGRFATTRARLASYLSRKIRERGWADEAPAEIEAVVERLSGLGYVDDCQYALSKARSLTARGYGPRRVNQSLHAAGIGEEDGEAARALAGDESVALPSAGAGTGWGSFVRATETLTWIMSANRLYTTGYNFSSSKAISTSSPGPSARIALEIPKP